MMPQVSARAFCEGERTPRQLCLNSPLKSQPTPLFLEHRLAEIRPNRWAPLWAVYDFCAASQPACSAAGLYVRACRWA